MAYFGVCFVYLFKFFFTNDGKLVGVLYLLYDGCVVLVELVEVLCEFLFFSR